MILYTIDSMAVDADDFRSRLADTGYYGLRQEERTWVHVPGGKQIIMVKILNGMDGSPHTFRVAIDK